MFEADIGMRYMRSHPSKEGMRIMADYAEEVLERCADEA